jgi:hypothetical protein
MAPHFGHLPYFPRLTHFVANGTERCWHAFDGAAARFQIVAVVPVSLKLVALFLLAILSGFLAEL